MHCLLYSIFNISHYKPLLCVIPVCRQGCRPYCSVMTADSSISTSIDSKLGVTYFRILSRTIFVNLELGSRHRKVLSFSLALW